MKVPKKINHFRVKTMFSEPKQNQKPSAHQKLKSQFNILKNRNFLIFQGHQPDQNRYKRVNLRTAGSGRPFHQTNPEQTADHLFSKTQIVKNAVYVNEDIMSREGETRLASFKLADFASGELSLVTPHTRKI